MTHFLEVLACAIAGEGLIFLAPYFLTIGMRIEVAIMITILCIISGLAICAPAVIFSIITIVKPKEMSIV